MGKSNQDKANTALQSQSGISQQTADIAKGLIEESAPARKQALNSYMAIAQGNRQGIQSAVAPQINSANQQFAIARRAAEAMPAGGSRDLALRNLLVQQAGAKTGIYSGGVSEANARLASLGMGGTQTAVGAYGQAGQGYGQVANQYNQMQQQSNAMWGSALGGIGGFLGGFG